MTFHLSKHKFQYYYLCIDRYRCNKGRYVEYFILFTPKVYQILLKKNFITKDLTYKGKNKPLLGQNKNLWH